MININDQLKEKFSIKCEKCNSSNVDVDFYSGYVSAFGSDVGHLLITCNDCKNEFKGEDSE